MTPQKELAKAGLKCEHDYEEAGLDLRPEHPKYWGLRTETRTTFREVLSGSKFTNLELAEKIRRIQRWHDVTCNTVIKISAQPTYHETGGFNECIIVITGEVTAKETMKHWHDRMQDIANSMASDISKTVMHINYLAHNRKEMVPFMDKFSHVNVRPRKEYVDALESFRPFLLEE